MQQKSGSSIGNHSRTATYTSSLLWSQHPDKCHSSGHNKRVLRPEASSKMSAPTCAWHVLCGVAFSCWRITPSDKSFVWAILQFYSNEEVEMVVDKWFQIQESNFWHKRTVYFMWRCGRCTEVLRDYILKTLILQQNEQASYSTYLASVCCSIIMLHISSCVFMYPAGYIIGYVLSCLHVNKLNQTEHKMSSSSCTCNYRWQRCFHN